MSMEFVIVYSAQRGPTSPGKERRANTASVLTQRLRRWPSTDTVLAKCVLFEGILSEEGQK